MASTLAQSHIYMVFSVAITYTYTYQLSLFQDVADMLFCCLNASGVRLEHSQYQPQLVVYNAPALCIVAWPKENFAIVLH